MGFMRNLISPVSPCLFKQPKCSLPFWVSIEKPWGNTGITIPKILGFLWVHQVHVECSSLQWEGWQRMWQWYYIYTVSSLAEQGKANKVFSCPWDLNNCLCSWPWSTSSSSHWHMCGPASPASVLLCSWRNTRLCLDVIVPSPFKE